jgi:chromosome segregation ATPase
LEGRIRELEVQVAELNRQLQTELMRRNELTQASESFREEMNGRLQGMEGKLRARSEEILALEQKNLEQSRKMTEQSRQLNEQITTITEEYYSANEAKQKALFECRRVTSEAETLEKQYSDTANQLAFLASKIEALNAELNRSEDREKADAVVGLGELEERLGEMRFRLEEREGENRELEGRIVEKDGLLKRLSEEYSSTLERVDQLEEAGSQFRQRNEDLQAELDRLRASELPSTFNAN